MGLPRRRRKDDTASISIKVTRARGVARDPQLNWIVGIWLGSAVLVENYVPISTTILKALDWNALGFLWDRLEIIAVQAQLQDSHNTVWIYFALSSPPMTLVFALSGGLRTYNRVTRTVLGSIVFGSLVLLCTTFLLGWIKVFRPTDTDFWTGIFYETPIGASLVIGSFAFVLSYSFGYLVWRTGQIIRTFAHFY